MHSYPFYVSNWRNSERVIAMTLEAQGAYRNLLDIAWERGSLPDDDRALQMLAFARDDEWLRIRQVVIGMFARGEDGRLHSDLIDQKRPAIVEAKAERASNTSNRRYAGGKVRAATAERTSTGRFTSKTPATVQQHHQQASLPYIRLSVSNDDDVARKPATQSLFSSDGEKHEEIRQVVNGGYKGDADAILKPMPMKRIRAQGAPAELVTCLESRFGLEDDDAANRLWEGCRRLDPLCTVEEVVTMTEIMRPKWTRPGIANRIGMLLTVVPLEFRDGGKRELQRYRARVREA